MSNCKFIFSILISIFLFKDLFSYIDPGSGSFFIQLIIAFFAGSLYLVKVFWRQIVAFFVRIFSFFKK
ncbi:MAG: hypothetical protein ACTSUG_00560 [Candidatus Helarchaeota archaeon]